MAAKPGGAAVWLSQTHRSLSSSTLSSSSSRERGGGARSLLAFSLMDSAEVLRHTVRELSFGFFGAEEVRGLSVKQVTSPQTFDVLGHALPGGLYDPAMGPAEKSSLCDTCGLGNADCPGHLGHIELPVPVYHPLLFAHMFRILRAKCLTCHKLKCSRLKALKGLVKLGLLDAGEGEAARNLDKELLTVPPRKKNRRRDLKRTADQVEADAAVDAAVHADEVLSGYQKKLKKTPRKDWLYSHDRALRRELVEAVLKSATGNRKCENCGAHTRSLRREGTTKIFQKPLSDRARQASEGMERPLLSALEALEQADDSDVEAPRAEISDSESGSTGDSGSESDSGSSDNDHSSESPNPRLSRLAQDKYMAPSEVEAQLRLLWEEDSPLLHALFGKAGTGMCVDSDRSGYCMFFLRVLPVPPTRFRPPGKVGDIDTEHPQNVHLSKVLELSERLQEMMGSKGRSGAGGSDESMSRMLTMWIELQNTVNCYMDSSQDRTAGSGKALPGIRQILEKKEGMFRMNMMGKRVNYACRSVISPDPYIGTTEIGIPLRFATTLTVPQAVAPWNVEHLRTLVERGATEHPGANFVEDATGKRYNLSRLSEEKRQGMAARLLSTPGQRVWRHLADGDAMLVNRQPTLHKPGIMAHHVRVLRNPSYQTIRMHYANCNTYNADFDGDEINCHLPQSEAARAEANLIAFTNEQYLVPTDGSPLRGLIQDSVDAGVKLSSMDAWLTRDEYQQLVFQALAGLPGLELCPPEVDIQILPPAILKPKQLWSGKQVFSTVLKHLIKPGIPLLNMEGKAKTPPAAFGEDVLEHQIIIRDGELLRGVLDKAAFGASKFGLVHAVHELYGPSAAGTLLTALGRVLVMYLQMSGHTCGIEDLTLTKAAEENRRGLIEEAISKGQQCMKDFILKKDPQAQLADESAVRDATASLLSGDDRKAQLAAIDSHIMGELSGATSAIIKACLPGGQEKPFPANCFSLMVLTGAKGSMVNHSQVSCALAQQALEGRRVPIMASGKSLPSFEAYDPSPRAGGYITDRFLTGIRPQEYYFHCMAGREGLVDTAVKTSRSGYLQRCLVKHLEELKVCYDGTVRDSEGCIQQFIYGEDGIDTTQSKYLSGQKDQMQFLAENYRALAYKYSLTEDFLDRMGFDLSATLSGHAAVERGTSSAIAAGDFVRARKLSPGQVEWSRSAIAKGWHNARVKKVHTKKSLVKYTLVYADGTVASKVPAEVSVEGRPESALLQSPKSMPLVELFVPPPVLSFLHASSQLGSVSESLQKSINDFIATQPRALDSSVGGINPETFRIMLWVKYMRSLAQAGEAVGAIAAQSVGEPSTQMTLNTFHLAGHGGANVTLGIPRLREIVMTASKNPTTPNMTALLRPSVSREEASEMARRLSKLPLVDLVRPVEGVVVREQLKRDKGGTWYRSYRVEVYFSDLELIRKAFGLSFDQICTASCQVLVSKLLTAATTALKKAGEVHTIKTFNGDGGGMFDAGESGSDSEDEGEGGEGVPAKATLSDDSDSSSDEDDADEPIKVAASVGLQKEGDGEDDEDSLAVWQAMAGKTAPTSQQRKVDNQPKISALSVSKAAQKHKLFAGVSKNKSAGMIAVSLKLPSEARRLMMADIATSTLEKCFVRSYEGIGRAYVVEKVVGGQERLALQMEGCNFATMWRLSPKEGADLLEINHITSSHIHEVCETYGVEACRAAIVSEITAVFGVYGIDVDARHLGLIADYMTFFGGYRPMNRAGMISAPSPFLQMSFETTANYLVQAAMEGKIDKLHGASSRIVMGQVGEMGTGSFDLRLPISTV